MAIHWGGRGPRHMSRGLLSLKQISVSALSAPTLTVTSATSAYPTTIDFTRPIDWIDGISAVMQRSPDPGFAESVGETINTINAATTTYDFGLSNAAGGTWYFRMAAWTGTRPGTLVWSNTVSATPVGYALRFNITLNSQYLPVIGI